MLDAQSGITKSSGGQASLGAFRSGDVYGKGKEIIEKRDPGLGDTGGASRFFYCAKASRAEREAGLEGMPVGKSGTWGGDEDDLSEGKKLVNPRSNGHPTVKPISLMRWLCRLVTPPGGLILDPFAGSGSTGCAAVLENFRFIGVEREAEYVAIAGKRIAACAEQPSLWDVA